MVKIWWLTIKFLNFSERILKLWRFRGKIQISARYTISNKKWSLNSRKSQNSRPVLLVASGKKVARIWHKLSDILFINIRNNCNKLSKYVQEQIIKLDKLVVMRHLTMLTRSLATQLKIQRSWYSNKVFPKGNYFGLTF